MYDYYDDTPFELCQKIIINDAVYEETQTAKDVAFEILENLWLIIIKMPETQGYKKRLNISSPLDDDIYNECCNVLDFGNLLNTVHYEEIGLLDLIC